jgi:uncharacterized protein HemX
MSTNHSQGNGGQQNQPEERFKDLVQDQQDNILQSLNNMFKGNLIKIVAILMIFGAVLGGVAFVAEKTDIIQKTFSPGENKNEIDNIQKIHTEINKTNVDTIQSLVESLKRKDDLIYKYQIEIEKLHVKNDFLQKTNPTN